MPTRNSAATGGLSPEEKLRAQLALNLAWTPTFFLAKKLDVALVVIITLLGALTTAGAAFWHVDKYAGLLFVPYFAWVAFATVLNSELLRLNPKARCLPARAGASRVRAPGARCVVCCAVHRPVEAHEGAGREARVSGRPAVAGSCVWPAAPALQLALLPWSFSKLEQQTSSNGPRCTSDGCVFPQWPKLDACPDIRNLSCSVPRRLKSRRLPSHCPESPARCHLGLHAVKP